MNLKMRVMPFFRIFCICFKDTKRTVLGMPFVRCNHHHTITRPRGFKKKWMTSLKMYLGISNGTCCNIFQGSKKYATRQWPANNRTSGLSLITSRSKRCASRQWAWIHGGWNLFLITGKHTKCVMRQWPTMTLCSWIKEWFLLIPMGYYFVCLRYCSLLFLIVLKLKKCVKMPLKKSMGIGVCCWSL